MSALLKVLLSVLLLDLQSQTGTQDPLWKTATCTSVGGGANSRARVHRSTHCWQGEEGHPDQGEGPGQQASGPGLGGLVSVPDGGQRDLHTRHSSVHVQVRDLSVTPASVYLTSDPS